jgi:acyl-CoA reductase-like NAD-dependent aldehyde dehydrogenase
VDNSIADAFVKLLVERIAKIKVGNHIEDPSVSLSGLCCCAAPKRILSIIDSAVDEGANLVVGDRKISGPNKTILQPHVLDNVRPSMSIFQEETFGPIICITQVASDDEAIAVANNSEYSLCASVFTRNVLKGMEFAQRIRAGSCHVNGPTVYIEPTLPNGGTGGRSGYGRFGGIAGVEEFTERKIVSLCQPGMKYSL